MKTFLIGLFAMGIVLDAEPIITADVLQQQEELKAQSEKL